MITIEAMRALEQQAIAAGTSELTLMQRAAKGIAAFLKTQASTTERIVFVCYHGNNGGDGMCAAAILAREGYTVGVVFVGSAEKLTPSARVQFNTLKQNYPHIFCTSFNNAYVLVDALLGIGVSGAIREPIASIVRAINTVDAIKVAIDIPTGLGTETAVAADAVVTMHDVKPGLAGFKTVTVPIFE